MTFKFITLGCKTNLYESEAMAALFREAGYQPAEAGTPADVCVVNTCTVTGVGAQKSRQQIRRARRENPGAVLAVTGCLAQTDAQTLREELDIDVILGTQNRREIVRLVELARQGTRSCQVGDVLKATAYEELGIAQTQSRIRANLKIEDGCDRFCAYCIIPYARGPVRSRELARIREEAEALGRAGYAEVVLTGIQIGAYGRDLPEKPGLMDVVEAVHQAAGIARIRLGSLEPGTITQDFVRRAAALPKLCPQFHLSLQSGCNATLARMRRRYTTGAYREAVELLRARIPDTAVTTDLMTGFPGETPEEFRESLDFCDSIGFAQMHIFPYSVRKGTAAAAFPDQVPEPEKDRRSREMLALAARSREAFCRRYLGRTLPVLLEQEKGGRYHGTAANYMDVAVSAPPGLEGRILPVRLEDFTQGSLTGTVEKDKREPDTVPVPGE